MLKQSLPKGYSNPKSLHRMLHKLPEDAWNKRGQAMALNLFRQMSARVPAYKDFLASNNFSPKDVRSIKDFNKIPTINKDNYLRKYPKEMLVWDGKFANGGSWTISTTSGSTGEPYYFPRTELQDKQYAICAEQYLINNFDLKNQSTLYIVAFPMGAWIGGVFTYEALKLIADRNKYNLSIITPGINKQEVINTVKQLGKSFDQIIIGAYAPFLKDILDDGTHQGLKWSDYKIGFVFSAEAFSETFRDYALEAVGANDVLRSSLNHYGTVDMGTMAHETPETILTRRELIKTKKLGLILPEPNRQPTICQYNPELFYFEEIENNLLCSAYSGLPLVRYDLKDYGGILNRKQTLDLLKENKIDIVEQSKKHKIDDISWNLPYLYIYERKDFSVSYYAFLIYPEVIRSALQDRVLTDKITGKFTMFVDYAKNGRQQLHINVEKKKDIKILGLDKQVLEIVHNKLLSESSEYFETFKMIGLVAKPHIRLWDYEDPIYFRSGGKQKWVIK